MFRTFTFFPDGDFWPTSVGILPESDGMHNLGLAEGSNTGSTDESGMAAEQEAADEEEEYRRQLSQPPLFTMSE